MLGSQVLMKPRRANAEKMRTYSRKRPEYKEIENVHNLCRLCLGKANEAISIFKNNESGDVCAAVALRIMICVGLEMTNEDCLPNTICQECHKELERYYTFRKKCETSYQKLKSHVLAVREREYNLKMAQQKEQNDMMQMQEDDEHGGSNLVFTINMDGTISVCENNVPSDGPLVTLKRLDDNNSLFTNKVIADFVQPSHLLKQSDTSSQLKLNDTRFQLLKQSDIGCQLLKDADTSSQLLKQSHTSVPKNNVSDSSKESLLPINGGQNPIANLQSPNNTNNSNSSTLNQPSVSLENTRCNIDETNNAPDEVEFTTFLSSMLVELGILSQQNETVEFVDTDIKMLELETGDGQQLTIELAEEDTDKEQHEEVVTIDGDEGKQSIVIQYITSNYNERHKNSGAPIKSPAWCTTCGKKFASMSVVARHVRDVHVRERPFACRVCGKTFAQKEVMLRHQHIHEAERPFKCGECSKSYSQRGALLAHARSHLPPHARSISLHQCPKCPKVFLYSSGLSRHMSTHTGRLYVCGGCRRQFNDKSALKRHMASANHDTSLPPPNLTPAPRTTANDTAG